MKYFNNVHTKFNANIRPFSTKPQQQNKRSLKYKEPSETYTDSDIKYGRHFAIWKCLKCNNNWSSAYSWISINFCSNNRDIITVKSKDEPNRKEEWFSGSKLKNNEFLIQECKQCCLVSDVKIVRYRNLLWKGDPDNIIPHRDDLCVKCLKGYKCAGHYNSTSGSII
jgi:hypothetical protein